MRLVFFLICLSVVLAILTTTNVPDLLASGLFYDPASGFYLRNIRALTALHNAASTLPRLMVVFFLLPLLLGITGVWQRKGWFFLLLALLIGPGLIANLVFKDHFGRARPHSITEFGGTATYTPPLFITNQCAKNCSFVSGDGAFGFFLPSFAYLLPLRRSRKAFWGLFATGSLFGIGRILTGHHFLSDVIFAAFFVTLTSALLYGIFYGWRNLLTRWNFWLGQAEAKPNPAPAHNPFIPNS